MEQHPSASVPKANTPPVPFCHTTTTSLVSLKISYFELKEKKKDKETLVFTLTCLFTRFYIWNCYYLFKSKQDLTETTLTVDSRDNLGALL